MLTIRVLLTPAAFIWSFNCSTNSSRGAAKFHLSTLSLTSSFTRCVFRLFKGTSGEVSTSSSFLRPLLVVVAAAAAAAPAAGALDAAGVAAEEAGPPIYDDIKKRRRLV